MNLRRACCFLLPLVLAACGAREAPPPEPSALIATQPAVTRSLQQTLEAYGTVEFAAAQATTLTVQVESRVSELLVVSGAEVRREQPLLRLAPSVATQLELDKARRDAEVAAVERARLQRLRRDGLATDAELHSAIAAAATAAALRDSLERRVGPGGVRTLLAPRDGIVDALTVQPGDLLAAGAVAVRVAAPDALQVRLGIEPEDLPRVAAAQTVKLAALNPGAATVKATVASLDRRIDPQTRLASALVNLPPAGGLLPGAALRAQIVIVAHEQAVAVPRAAMLYAADQPSVFIADGGKARRRKVQLGLQDGDWVEITSGVKAGEPVIVAGNAALEDGMAVRAQVQAKPASAAENQSGKVP